MTTLDFFYLGPIVLVLAFTALQSALTDFRSFVSNCLQMAVVIWLISGFAYLLFRVITLEVR